MSRSVLVSLVASLLMCVPGAALPAAAQPLQPDGVHTLAVSVFTPDPPTGIARAAGALSAAGLEVAQSITPNSTEQMRGLSNGTYDIVSTAFDNVLAWSGREGATIVAVAELDQHTLLPVYARPEIGDWSDLRGRPLAVDATDTAFALVLRRVLLAHDLDLNRGDYTLVPLGATAARLSSLLAGETYAGVLNAPFDAQGEAGGLHFLADQREVLPEYPGTVLAVRQDWARDNRDVLVNYLRVWRAAGEMVEMDPEGAARLFSMDTGLPLPTARNLLPTEFNHGQLNVPGLQSVLGLRTTFGYQLPMGTQLSRFYDESYWRAAVGSK